MNIVTIANVLRAPDVLSKIKPPHFLAHVYTLYNHACGTYVQLCMIRVVLSVSFMYPVHLTAMVVDQSTHSNQWLVVKQPILSGKLHPKIN